MNKLGEKAAMTMLIAWGGVIFWLLSCVLAQDKTNSSSGEAVDNAQAHRDELEDEENMHRSRQHMKMLVALGSVNVLLLLAVNFVYVYAESIVSGAMFYALGVLLALFKNFWGSVVLEKSLSMIRNSKGMKRHVNASSASAQDIDFDCSRASLSRPSLIELNPRFVTVIEHVSSSEQRFHSLFDRHVLRRELMFRMFCAISNFIIIPVLVSAAWNLTHTDDILRRYRCCFLISKI